MVESSQHDKTEAPTPRRREKARAEGRVAHSPDLTSAIVLFGLALLLRRMGPTLANGLHQLLRETLAKLAYSRLGVGEAAVMFRWLGVQGLWLTGGLCAFALSLGLLAAGLQVGLRINTNALAINWSRISPAHGWQRLAAGDGWMRGAGAAFKALLAGCLALWIAARRWDELQLAASRSLLDSVRSGWDVCLSVTLAVATGALVWAAADYLYRWWRHEQELRMSRQELADEHKEDEGHPQLRARMRQAQRQAAARKSLKAVPEATIILTNPTHIAVALQYRLGQAEAPRVVAKGKGAFAQRIIRLARQHGVPVEEAKPIARALYKHVAVGQEIPASLFTVVAEVLARLYQRKRAG